MTREAFDFIVIGAGIAGASAAAEISADARVLLLEVEARPGMHATGRSAAYFAPAYGNAVVRNLTLASQAFFNTPPAGFTDVPLIKQRDALFIATRQQAASLASMQIENPTLTAVGADNLEQRVAILRPGIIEQGLLDQAGGDLDVDAILQGYLRQFRRHQGTLLTSKGVSQLAYQQGLWQVKAGDTIASAPVVINAAGAWADQVAGLAGLAPIGLVPKRRTACLIDAPASVDIRDWPLVIDMDEQFYFKPDAGLILVSPADETPSEPCDAQPEELDIAIAMDRLLAVADIAVPAIKHRWAGLRTFAPDNTFVVGQDPRLQGFFWLAGQGGYGVQSAPGMSNLARHLLLGASLPAGFERVRDSIEAVSPARFLNC